MAQRDLASGYIGRCDSCNKISFTSRKSAKQVARRSRNARETRPYPCPSTPGLFHLGNLGRRVVAGQDSRADAYNR